MACYSYAEAGSWNGTRCRASCYEDAKREYDCIWHTMHEDPQSLPLHQDDGDTEPSAAAANLGPEMGCTDCGHPETPFDGDDREWLCPRHGGDYVRPAAEAKGQDTGEVQIAGWLEFEAEDVDGNRLVTIFCPTCSTLMTAAEHEAHDCGPAASEGTGQ